MANNAPKEIDLLTIAKIEASIDVLSVWINTIKVIQVQKRFVVKIGFSILSLKVENIVFVAYHSKVLVPKVHSHFIDPET